MLQVKSNNLCNFEIQICFWVELLGAFCVEYLIIFGETLGSILIVAVEN